jgi:membrane protein DedA with SNARE-associated domain
MSATLDFVIRHGYAVLFTGVLAEQIGLPVPALPLLLGMGALAGTGQLALAPALAVCVLACLIADLVWYVLGRSRGGPIIGLLCRISLEPDSCVRRTENVFLRYGPRALLFAKFVPGLSTAAPPLAGMFRMPVWRFGLFDGLGSLAWAGGYALVGYVFREQVEAILALLLRMGSWLLTLTGGLLALYVAFKFIQRRRFYRKLRVARITPQQLLELMETDDGVTVIDLRNSLEREDDPVQIPGAIAINYEDLEERHVDIPRDRDIVLYCT